MFCENCGKSLIRGYQFCLECGTPVPPEDENSKPEIVEQDNESAETSAGPRVEPLNGGEGTLVFCPNCGMRMQTSTTVCEKCGISLGGGAPNGYAAPTASIGDEMASLSPSEIDSINSFANGDSLGGGSLDEIEKLTAQLEKLGSTSSAMPAIGSPSHNSRPAPRRQPTLVPMGEPDPGFDNSAYNKPTDDVPVISPKPVRHENPSDAALGEPVPVIENISMSADDNAEYLPLENDPTRVMSFDIDKTPEVEMTDPNAEALSMPFDIAPVEPIPAAEPVVPFYQQSEPAPVAEAPAEPTEFFAEPAPVAEAPAEPTEFFAEPAPVAEAPAEPTEFFAEPAPVAEAPAESTEFFAEPAPDVDPAELFGNGQSEPERKPTSSIDSYEPERKPTSSIDSYEPERKPTSSIDDYSSSYSDPYDSPEWDIKPDKSYRPHDYVEEEDEKSNEPEEAPAPDLGKLIYCRNCGQDMFEKETFCKNCGSPNLWDKKPLKHHVSASNGKSAAPTEKKEVFKIFGVIPLPTAIVAVVAIIGIIVLVATTNTSTQVPVDMSSKTSASTTSAAPVESDTSSDPVIDNNAVGGSDATSSEVEPINSEPVDTSSDVSQPEVTEPIESTPEVSRPDDSRPVVSSSSKPVSSKTTATSKTTPKVTTKTSASSQAAVVVPSSTVKSQNADRDNILAAVESMAGEIGKIQVLATSAIDAINEDSRAADTALTSYYNRDYASNLVSIVKGGKSAVDKAYSAAKPKNTVFNSAYKSLGSLYNAYKAYYDYVINPGKGSTYETKCNSYYSSFVSAAKELKLSNLKTSDQTSSDENQMILDALSNAATAAKNSANQYGSLRSKIAELKSNQYDSEIANLLNKSANQKLYTNAAMYGEIAIIYSSCIIDKAPTDGSSGKTNLSVIASELDNLFVEVENAEQNTLSGIKNNIQTSIDTINSAVKKVG